jgi:DNA-binding CsgD family transcriptional regulator/tetratricopeptide (TPR) repeat protein
MPTSDRTVGRDAELASIDAFLDEPRAGLAALVIEGDMGIGKTTLWREAVRAAGDRSCRVLVTRPAETETTIGFAGLVDLLGQVADEAVQELPEPQRVALDTALLRGLAEAPVARGAVAVAVAGALRALARAAPLVIAIDDAQWLDAPTRAALGFALRRLEGEPIAVVAAQRTGSPGARFLDQIATVQLRVLPLSLGATYQLVRGRLGVALARPTLVRIHETSGGNPFFALELARAVIEKDQPLGSGGHVGVPERLGDLLRGRVDRMPDRTRDVLLLAAAMGAASAEDLRRAAGATGDQDIELAEKAGILDTRDGTVRFAHPLFAAAVYDRAAGAERRRIHRALAGVLADPEARASHLALAASGPDAEVAAALDDAARTAARRGATDVAARLVERALELTPASEPAPAFQRALTAGALVLAAGDRSRARSLFERAVADAPDGPGRAEALLRLAEVSDPLGHGLALCDRALQDAGVDPSLSSRIHRTRGGIAYFLGDVPTAEHHARLGVELAERSHDARALGMAVAELGHWTFCGGGGVLRDLFERAVALDGSAGALSPRSHLAKVLMDNDVHDEARELLVGLLADSMVYGDLHAASTHLLHLAELETWAGEWVAAVAHAEEALQLRQHTEHPSAPLYVKAMAQACLGLLDEARREADAGRAEAERAEDVVFQMQNLHVLGFVELSLGNLDAARAHLGTATDLLRPRWNKEFGDCHVVPDEIEALTGIGDLLRAEDLTAWMEEVGERTGRPWTLATAGRSRALVRAAKNDLDGAEEALESALVAHQRLPMPFELGRTLLVRGVVRRRMRRRAAAREALEESLGVFERLGAGLWAQKARAEIARIGVRTQAQTGLTPIEQRIAALVAEGRTNRQIADALFLSVKTVEANLSRLYRKVGVRSRTELAARSVTGA